MGWFRDASAMFACHASCICVKLWLGSSLNVNSFNWSNRNPSWIIALLHAHAAVLVEPCHHRAVKVDQGLTKPNHHSPQVELEPILGEAFCDWKTPWVFRCTKSITTPHSHTVIPSHTFTWQPGEGGEVGGCSQGALWVVEGQSRGRGLGPFVQISMGKTGFLWFWKVTEVCHGPWDNTCGYYIYIYIWYWWVQICWRSRNFEPQSVAVTKMFFAHLLIFPILKTRLIQTAPGDLCSLKRSP